LEEEEVESVSKKTSKVSGSEGDDDNEEDVELDDEADGWNKADEDWDPDFAEFDLPKSKTAKKSPGGKKGAKDDDDFKIDDEFKDLFGGSSPRQDNDDDF
jgi:sodium/potassium-transporting ATPase subunit alpha